MITPVYDNNDYTMLVMTPLREEPTLPRSLESALREASFYATNQTVTNIWSAVQDGHECIVFDSEWTGEDRHRTTFAAIKAASPKHPATWLSRSSGLQLERAGDWLLGFENDRSVDIGNLEVFLADILKLVTYAKEFPQNN